MATAEDFRDAANRFGALKEGAFSQSGWLGDDWGNAVNGGRLAHVVGEAISASDGMTRSIRTAFFELQEECTRRAEVCDAYQRTYDTYTSELDDFDAGRTRVRPFLPPKPAPWVDVK